MFVCEPEVADRERECADRITTNLVRRASRRPVEPSDLDRLMPFYEEGRKGAGGFDEGIELMTAAVLVEPRFSVPLDRAERRAAMPASQRAHAFELASRLSFFLWGQGPDDELLKLAESGELAQPSVLRCRKWRACSPIRGRKCWFRASRKTGSTVDDLEAVQPDMLLFPEFTEACGKISPQRSACF